MESETKRRRISQVGRKGGMPLFSKDVMGQILKVEQEQGKWTVIQESLFSTFSCLKKNLKILSSWNRQYADCTYLHIYAGKSSHMCSNSLSQFLHNNPRTCARGMHDWWRNQSPPIAKKGEKKAARPAVVLSCNAIACICVVSRARLHFLCILHYSASAVAWVAGRESCGNAGWQERYRMLFT